MYLIYPKNTKGASGVVRMAATRQKMLGYEIREKTEPDDRRGLTGHL